MIFYNKIKGELEDMVKRLNFKSISILQPSILERGKSERIGERLVLNIIKMFNALGFFKKYKAMPTNILASKMIKLVKKSELGVKTITLDRIFDV